MTDSPPERFKYEAIGGEKPSKSRNTDALTSKQHWYGAQLQLVALNLLGAGAMVGHHYFCLYLDGKEVNTNPLLGMRCSEQALIGVTGNAIASIASFVFGTTIGIVFVQVLWSSLRNKGLAIGHIQAVMECRTSSGSNVTPDSYVQLRAITKWYESFMSKILSYAWAG